MTTNYISLKSVLYDLSLTIDDRYWNEVKMYEWLTQGLRQLKLESIYEDKVTLVTISSHKGQLPTDFKYLTQIAEYVASTQYEVDTDQLAAPSNYDPNLVTSLYPWRAMRMSSNPYHASICLDVSLYNCEACEHSFTISPSGVITTTLQDGYVLVAYKGFVAEDGEILIPDSEVLKEALLHYALYRYWFAKYNMKEEGAERMMMFNLQRWNALSRKSLSLNNPDVSQLENLKNIHNRLVPRTNRFDQLFLTLSNRENGNI